MLPQALAVLNSKGGVGKTSICSNVAGLLAAADYRVLVVDLDPQGSTTEWLGGSESPTGLVEFSAGGVPIAKLASGSTIAGVDLVPTSRSLVPPGETSPNETGLAIVRAFARLPDYWDIVLIDPPPALGYLSLAPLAACDHVIIPVEAHALALPGVASVVASIERARLHVNRRLELLGIVACRVNATSHSNEIVARLRSQFGAAVLKATVRDAIQIAEAPALRLPITQYAPTSAVAADYRAVAAELLDRLGDLRS